MVTCGTAKAKESTLSPTKIQFLKNGGNLTLVPLLPPLHGRNTGSNISFFLFSDPALTHYITWTLKTTAFRNR